MEPILLARVAALVAGTGAAAYTDAKTGLILDKITYPMILLGVVLNLLAFDLWLFFLPIAVFVVGYALYWLGKIGGGDVKLLAAIAMLLPYYKGHVFLVHMLLLAAVASIVFYSVYYTAKYWRKGIDFGENRKNIAGSALMLAMVSAYFYCLLSVGMLPFGVMLLFYATMLFALVFLALEKGIKRNFFLKEVSLEKLEEDEVIAMEFLDEKTRNALGVKLKGVLGKKEVKALQSAGIKKVPVYRGMPPFAPFIFIGIVIELLYPELFGFLII